MSVQLMPSWKPLHGRQNKAMHHGKGTPRLGRLRPDGGYLASVRMESRFSEFGGDSGGGAAAATLGVLERRPVARDEAPLSPQQRTHLSSDLLWQEGSGASLRKSGSKLHPKNHHCSVVVQTKRPRPDQDQDQGASRPRLYTFNRCL